ncbi:MAG: ribulose 1,5-bisphosphate carboxylase large subunit [Nitrospira defluvii]|nr:ribulose 1,5-bisphosphate carboxylase large subunit [Nitrospira defluvii]
MPQRSTQECDLRFSGQRFSVEYHIHRSAAEARARADLLCIEQTVEAADHVIPSGAIRDQLLGRVIELESLSPALHRAVISFPTELLDGSVSTLLHMTFGMASLRGQVRATDLSLPDDVVSHMVGPRFGSPGLRELLQVPKRPLVCAVLKPLGFSPQQLAALAYEFALGEIDMIKDDQSLGDQPFCRFEERIARCVDAVSEASRQTGKRCLYAPHISSPWPILMERAGRAQKAGAGALLVCPGLTGFDAMASLARLPSVSLPLVSHPDFLGSHYVSPNSGIAPSVLFGLLPRLAGADISIYPTYGLTYPISQADCRQIAASCRRSLGSCPPIFPTAAGRMTASRIDEMGALYGRDLVYILGSDLRREPQEIQTACREFLRLVEKEMPSP